MSCQLSKKKINDLDKLIFRLGIAAGIIDQELPKLVKMLSRE